MVILFGLCLFNIIWFPFEQKFFEIKYLSEKYKCIYSIKYFTFIEQECIFLFRKWGRKSSCICMRKRIDSCMLQHHYFLKRHFPKLLNGFNINVCWAWIKADRQENNWITLVIVKYRYPVQKSKAMKDNHL